MLAFLGDAGTEHKTFPSSRVVATIIELGSQGYEAHATGELRQKSAAGVVLELVVGIDAVDGDGAFGSDIGKPLEDEGIVTYAQVASTLLVHAGDEQAVGVVQLSAESKFIGYAAGCAFDVSGRNGQDRAVLHDARQA